MNDDLEKALAEDKKWRADMIDKALETETKGSAMYESIKVIQSAVGPKAIEPLESQVEGLGDTTVFLGGPIGPMPTDVPMTVEVVPMSMETEGQWLRRTNKEYAKFCSENYIPESLNDKGHRSLDGLWAWQGKDRQMRNALTAAAPGLAMDHRGTLEAVPGPLRTPNSGTTDWRVVTDLNYEVDAPPMVKSALDLLKCVRKHQLDNERRERIAAKSEDL